MLAENLLVHAVIPALLFRCRPGPYTSFPTFRGRSWGREGHRAGVVCRFVVHVFWVRKQPWLSLLQEVFITPKSECLVKDKQEILR